MINSRGFKMKLVKITNKLIKDLHFLKDHFFKTIEMEDEQAFFAYVKGETDSIFEHLHEWEAETLQYIKNNKSAVHLKQVIATKENIELLIIHSFYKDMRKRRFMEYYNSSLYVLNDLRSEIE